LGGAVGYFGYEAMRYFEPTCAVTKNSEGQQAYDVDLMFFDRMLIFDHFKQKVILVAHLQVSDDLGSDHLKEQYENIVLYLENWAKELFYRSVNIPSLPDITLPEKTGELARSTMSKQAYMDLVERAKEYIRAGDIFQIVPSQRWTWEEAPFPMEVYRILRVVNPSPYMFYLRMGEETIVGSSPELLVRVNEQTIETRPIAGSRPRGNSKEEDEYLVADLLADEKERAEHVMLVDLGRNDLGRVAKYGTVQVTSYMNIEKYSHVMHMVSHVKAERDERYSRLDAFKACFPAGTVSGSPKIRAMEIIAELEPHPRGVYAGSIGYFSFTGHLDSCIAIRTIYFKNGKAYVQAGGGIVADSDPEKEYEETINKAKGMLRALELASEERKVESVR
jgi:anthranilate synthase component 1